MPDMTVLDLLERRARDTPLQEVVFLDGRETYPELERSIRELSAALWALGLRPGDALGLLLHPCLDSYRLWFAAARVGAVTVPINPRLKPRELRHLITDGDVRLLVTTAEFGPVLHETFPALAGSAAGRLRLDDAPELRTIVALDAPVGNVPASFVAGLDRAADPAAADAARKELRPSDPVLILYTSGTTSSPRGCVHDHRALVAQGEAVAAHLRLGPEDRFWVPLPMFHCGGFNVVMATLAGRSGMVHSGPFQPGRALEQLEQERCTVGFPAFETIWLPVLNHPRFESTDLSALRAVINVGPPERLRAMQAKLPQTIQIQSLGMTESFGFCCLGSLDDPPEARAASSGLALQHMECRVVDPFTGEDTPPGVPGEWMFRGPSRLVRYHGDPKATSERIIEGGWFRSGDLVVKDEAGRMTFVSRMKDMLKVGGENVAPAEVEGLLSEHPAVGIVQVVGAPDARYGEVPAAFVQRRDQAEATEEELIQFCLGAIATFKVPRYVRFVEEFPMSGTKVQKFRLRQAIADELAAAGITEAPVLSSTAADSHRS